MTVATILVHYNAVDECIHLLKQLSCFRLCNHKIVVIDNNSRRSEYQALQKLSKHIAFDLIENEKNMGYGPAINIAAAYAIKKYNPEFFHILNTDVEIIKKGYLLNLIEILCKTEQAGVIGPAVYRDDRTIQNTILPYPSIWSVLFFKKRFKAKSFISSNPVPIKVKAINGVCMVFKACAFNEIGGFDNNIFMYAEEQDICYRLVKRNYHVLFWPGESIIHHEKSANGFQKMDWKYIAIRKNQVRFIKKHSNALHAYVVFVIFWLSGFKKFVFARDFFSQISFRQYSKELFKF